MSVSRIVDGIEYGPIVTIVRNADGTIERVKEELDAQMVQQLEEQHAAEAAARQALRLKYELAARKRATQRQAARGAKVAMQAAK